MGIGHSDGLQSGVRVFGGRPFQVATRDGNRKTTNGDPIGTHTQTACRAWKARPRPGAKLRMDKIHAS